MHRSTRLRTMIGLPVLLCGYKTAKGEWLERYVFDLRSHLQYNIHQQGRFDSDRLEPDNNNNNKGVSDYLWTVQKRRIHTRKRRAKF